MNRHAGEDIYVLGSGASLDHIPPAFFAGRVTIGCNEVALVYGQTRYTVTKYHDCARRTAVAFPGSTVLVSRFQHGNLDEREAADMPPNVVAFDHLHNRGEDFDATRDWPTDPAALVVSWSTITTAMHAAAVMGARSIILVGHDRGPVDGRLHVRGYPEPQNPDAWLPYLTEASWLSRIAYDSAAVAAQIEARYGTPVLTLGPLLPVREAVAA